MAIEPIEDDPPVRVDSPQPLELSPAQLAEREARFAFIDQIHARLGDVPESEVLEDIAEAIAAVRAARHDRDDRLAPTTPAPG